MRRTYPFSKPVGVVVCNLPDGSTVTLPIFVGLFKHAKEGELCNLLKRYNVARKYTTEALKVAPWQVLRHFPKEWLLAMMDDAKLSSQRQRALKFLLTD